MLLFSNKKKSQSVEKTRVFPVPLQARKLCVYGGIEPIYVRKSTLTA